MDDVESVARLDWMHNAPWTETELQIADDLVALAVKRGLGANLRNLVDEVGRSLPADPYLELSKTRIVARALGIIQGRIDPVTDRCTG